MSMVMLLDGAGSLMSRLCLTDNASLLSKIVDDIGSF
jgi:hypothetical protein